MKYVSALIKHSLNAMILDPALSYKNNVVHLYSLSIEKASEPRYVLVFIVSAFQPYHTNVDAAKTRDMMEIFELFDAAVDGEMTEL